MKMKTYETRLVITDDDNFDLVLDGFNEMAEYLECEKELKSYFEEDLKNIKIIVEEYVMFTTPIKRRRELLQHLANINNYIVEIINKNMDGISIEILDFLVEKKRQLRLNKINRIISFD